jgi:hypothetical protein
VERLAGDDAGGPVLSEAESSLGVEVKNFFRERITMTLGRSYEVEFDRKQRHPFRKR